MTPIFNAKINKGKIKLIKTMIGKLFCKIGLHKWFAHRWDGLNCRRCGKNNDFLES